LPGHFECGTTCSTLLSNLDFCPTILDICGVSIPRGLEGYSFAPLFDERRYRERGAVYGALYYDAAYDPIHMVRTNRYKYIRSFAVTAEESAGADSEMLAKHHTGKWIRADDSDVQRGLTWLSMKKKYAPPPAEELYDLEEDPLEQRNIADSARHSDILNDLREKLQKMMERTGSPLLRGHVSPSLSLSGNKRLNTLREAPSSGRRHK